mmetsp:Transcript_26387/g.47566  ORF Transcript_26387/g.47566 Transcript_26387/m.47566 type:complete len:102 (+) Transcript_26387:30-335(+)
MGVENRTNKASVRLSVQQDAFELEDISATQHPQKMLSPLFCTGGEISAPGAIMASSAPNVVGGGREGDCSCQSCVGQFTQRKYCFPEGTGDTSRPLNLWAA